MSSNQNFHMSHQRKATLLMMMSALMFTLSSLPGLGTKAIEESSDLSSVSNQFRSCDIEGQIAADGNADCNAISTGSNKFSGNVHIEKVAATETTEASYTITGEFSITCKACDEGVRSQPLDMTVKNIAEARQKLAEQATTLSEETKLAEQRATCKLDEYDEEMSKAEQLQCHMDKMVVMDERDARKYYDKWIKGPLSDLAKSDNAQDAALAASLAAELNGKMEVNCSSVMAQVQQAGMIANQPFNPYAAPTATKSTPTDYIKESTCDIMAMGNYNRQLLGLGAQLKGPNSQVAAQQITNLQNQWGGYFTARGLVLNSPTMTQINLDAGSLMTQINDFQKGLAENFAAIQERHKNLLEGNGANTSGTTSPAVDPRLLRGGGTPVTGLEQPNGNPPAVLAPKMGSPVGS